ncbi:MAG: hypothetical protein R3362_05935, partial [Rhodothermales bacterium]|nr:hypothetical protein [Rhodothermales bacterium]
LLVSALAPAALAQEDGRAGLPGFIFDPTYYSDRTFEKKALMDGNEVALTFFNYGLLGGSGEVRGNWPNGSDDFYIGDVLPVVAVEYPVDTDGDGSPDTLLINTVTTRGPRQGIGDEGPLDQPGVFWGFEAKPEFAAGALTREQCLDREEEIEGDDADGLNDRPALSTDDCTWPDRWPDQPSWIDPTTGASDWNGFFGRDQFNADLETYFWMDDVNDAEPQFFAERAGGTFQADSTRPDLESLGLVMSVRGFQWSQFLAEDAIFWLYEVTNTSTTTYPRVAVGLTVGTLAGGDGDSQDDLAFFDQANRIVYSWDFDDSGNQNQDVGYVGYGFLESPGDADNAIDDDGDGDPTTELGRDPFTGVPFVDPALAGSGNVFTQADFAPRTLAVGDPLVLIDDETGERSFAYVEDGETTVVSQGRSYTVFPGLVLEEEQETLIGQAGGEVVVTVKNLLDDDLDGVVDEDLNLHGPNRRFQNLQGEIETLPALRYENWLAIAESARDGSVSRQDSVDAGLLNLLIDEARDDGIDNDGDWNALDDDVGADGLEGTGDLGEGNGVPDPGEPNFDALDVTESDQVGLSSFFYFTPPGALSMNADQELWSAMTPGFFTTNEELAQQQSGGGVDGDFIFGSGYFRLEPGETLRFTLATVFGNDLQDITNNTQTIQEIYNRNYQFARPPDRPTLGAVPGDGRVTLYWDSASLDSEDPVLGNDFQGYRIFKSTDPFFDDPEVVTDVFGNEALLVPEFQFDLDDGIEGFFTSNDARVRGVPFPLGDDTGLRFSVVDTNVVNGQRYYYGITAYDSGSQEFNFYPAENNLAITVREDGTVITGQNTVEVIPNAPAAGYEGAEVLGEVVQLRGSASGDVFAEVIDPRMVPDAGTYTVTFSGEEPAADSFFVARNGEPIASGLVDRAESVVFDGIRLVLNNVETRLNPDSTGYTATSRPVEELQELNARVIAISDFGWTYNGEAVPYDYEVRFADGFVGESLGGFRLGTGFQAPTAVARPTNFTVYNTTLDREAEFVFYEPGDGDGRFNAFEYVFIYEEVDGELTPTFQVRPEDDDAEEAFPGAGEVYTVATFKPFSSRDAYRVEAAGARVDEAAARAELDRIGVVPNPYVAAASWERPLAQTQTSGRGERRIDFIH